MVPLPSLCSVVAVVAKGCGSCMAGSADPFSTGGREACSSRVPLLELSNGCCGCGDTCMCGSRTGCSSECIWYPSPEMVAGATFSGVEFRLPCGSESSCMLSTPRGSSGCSAGAVIVGAPAEPASSANPSRAAATPAAKLPCPFCFSFAKSPPGFFIARASLRSLTTVLMFESVAVASESLLTVAGGFSACWGAHTCWPCWRGTEGPDSIPVADSPEATLSSWLRWTGPTLSGTCWRFATSEVARCCAVESGGERSADAATAEPVCCIQLTPGEKPGWFSSRLGAWCRVAGPTEPAEECTCPLADTRCDAAACTPGVSSSEATGLSGTVVCAAWCVPELDKVCWAPPGPEALVSTPPKPEAPLDTVS